MERCITDGILIFFFFDEKNNSAMFVSRLLLFSVLGYTAYTIAQCPCERIGYCKRNEFLLLSAVPLAFALYNFAPFSGSETAECAS